MRHYNRGVYLLYN